MLFSPSKIQFYPEALLNDYRKSGILPGDLVEVDDKKFAEYGLKRPPVGKFLSARDGVPAWCDLPAAPESSLADLAAAAMSRINTGYSATIAQILVDYPDAETLSFDKQEAQARAWDEWQAAGAVPDDEPPTPYLDAMLAERPIGKSELVGRIIAKAEAFTIAHGQATGRRQRLEDQVKAALDAEDRAAFEAITW